MGGAKRYRSIAFRGGDGFRGAQRILRIDDKTGSSDLPVGRFVDRRVESHLQKYFCFHAPQIKSRTHFVLPTEGRIAIVTDAGWDAVDAAALARDGVAGQV
jgi:hypothetical protein